MRIDSVFARNIIRMKKIIIIDDDESILASLGYIFRYEGYGVVTYSSGLPVIRNDFELPDLFIIDHQMKEVNGLDVCLFLKGQILTRHIPVLMISGTAGIRPRAKEAGADAFLEKPFDLAALLSIVSRLIYPAG